MIIDDGWLTNFKRRWGLKTFKAHAESGDSDRAALEEAFPDLKRINEAFNPCNLFDAETCGLLYKLGPDFTVALRGPVCRKK